MEIVLASRNKNKIKELQALINDAGLTITVLSLNDIGYFDDIEEDGKTFYENSIIKASVPAKLGYIGVADDSGICVDYLNGEPGVYSARYAGEPCNDENNNIKLLDALINVPKEQRTAFFVSNIACVIPQKFNPVIPNSAFDNTANNIATSKAGTNCYSFTTEGKVSGRILTEPIGNGGFGYDPIFYVNDKDKSYAQLTDAEKNEVSHRGKAFREFIKILEKVELC